MTLIVYAPGVEYVWLPIADGAVPSPKSHSVTSPSVTVTEQLIATLTVPGDGLHKISPNVGSGAGVGVGVGVGSGGGGGGGGTKVGVGEGVGVGEAVGEAVGVGVAVGRAVGLAVGRAVGLGVRVGRGVRAGAVTTGTGVGVASSPGMRFGSTTGPKVGPFDAAGSGLVASATSDGAPDGPGVAEVSANGPALPVLSWAIRMIPTTPKRSAETSRQRSARRAPGAAFGRARGTAPIPPDLVDRGPPVRRPGSASDASAAGGLDAPMAGSVA